MIAAALGILGLSVALVLSPPAQAQIPATPASRRPSTAIPLQSTGTDGKPDPQQNVDWARFTQSVQNATKKPDR